MSLLIGHADTYDGGFAKASDLCFLCNFAIIC